MLVLEHPENTLPHPGCYSLGYNEIVLLYTLLPIQFLRQLSRSQLVSLIIMILCIFL